MRNRNNFDSLRFLGAFAVLVSHAFPIAYGARSIQPLQGVSRGQTDLGTVAVLVFFVISGYLITQSFDRRPSPWRFLRARLLRIFPALFVVLALTVALGACVTTLSLAQYLLNPDTIKYVPRGLSLLKLRFQLPGVFADNPVRAVVNGSLWTLYYEFLMYIVVLGLGMAGVLRRTPVLAAWAGALGLSGIFPDSHDLSFGAPFLAGAALYLWRDAIPLRGWPALASLAILAVSLRIGGFPQAFAAFGAYLTLFLATSGAVPLPDFARHGDLSYGIYVFAWPVQQTVALIVAPTLSWYLNVALSIPIVLGLAWLSWRWVEKPALSLK